MQLDKRAARTISIIEKVTQKEKGNDGRKKQNTRPVDSVEPL
jgi:hypothetical protein